MQVRVLRILILALLAGGLLSAKGVVSVHSPVSVARSGVFEPPITDVSVVITTDCAPRPGFLYTYHIVLRNKGTAVTSATLSFVKDTKLGNPTSVPEGASFDGNTLSIPFDELQPNEVRMYQVCYLVPSLPDVGIGDYLSAFVSVGLEQDVATFDNIFQKKEAVSASYDPNDLTEAHGEKIVLSTFADNELLYYTVRFENTNTAAASFLIIEDLLDPQLDPSTIMLVSSSHYVTMGRTDNKVRFLFPDIDLPPSMPDMNIGKGQVTFSVKPFPGLQVGDVIPNQAHIFFDFNPPVSTNVFETEFVASLSNETPDRPTFRAFPNPVRDILTVTGLPSAGVFSLYALSGQQLLVRPSYDNTSMIDVSFLAAGNYLLRWEGENSRWTVMITKP
ncbi:MULTISPECIES: T9SS type A sorting domain-containing protein [unclassified Flavobacterium]|uniref:T9SS type A sorting domain-containing protein n=1 Tax=unclassified Flavobacterium TaxID=196869 RepID=UPI001F12FF11|nr:MULTISPECIES: T9SS type A sorting domain-containing protein [unclassified Flavobacterium]UMY66598.1 T9SS type A sorting domain-containing protein [Flavobacterium sp. HJ-32-4]